METIRLYRGDHTKINEFNVSRTNKRCLVGPGIYLTNNYSIAESYRLKNGKHSRIYGSHTEKTVILKSVKTNNIGEAIQDAFTCYFDMYWMLRYHSGEKNSKAYFDRFKQDAYRQYRFDIEEGIVKFKRVRKNIRVTDKIFLRGYVVRSEDWVDCYIDNPEYEKIGYLSIFEFDRKLIQYATVKLGFIREPYSRDLFSDITNDHDIQWDWAANTSLKVNLHNAKMAKRYFEPYGYIGIEYPGGTSTRHRAFCIWNEDLINQHIVNRVR